MIDLRHVVPVILILVLSGCASSLPEEKHKTFTFPEMGAFVELPTGKYEKRPFETLGWVRTKVNYPTMEQDPNNTKLCKNYYNKGVAQLLNEAKKAGGEAVIQIRSVVMLMDHSVQEYATPECYDDGAEGELLLRGVAIKYKKIPPKPPTAPAAE